MMRKVDRTAEQGEAQWAPTPLPSPTAETQQTEALNAKVCACHNLWFCLLGFGRKHVVRGSSGSSDNDLRRCRAPLEVPNPPLGHPFSSVSVPRKVEMQTL